MLVHPKKTKGHQRRLYQHDKPENGLIETNRVSHNLRDKIEMKEFILCSLTVSSQNILIVEESFKPWFVEVQRRTPATTQTKKVNIDEQAFSVIEVFAVRYLDNV